MIFRKATMDDLDAIHQIYEAIHAEEQSGKRTIGWDPKVYPVRQTAENAILAEEMYVCEDRGQIVAAAIMNHMQYEGYAHANWSVEAKPEEVLVLHTLVVMPNRSGQGIGKAMVAFYEGVAKGMGCLGVRFDTNEKNAAARAFYPPLGYKEVGIIPSEFNGLPDVNLVLYEKYL